MKKMILSLGAFLLSILLFVVIFQLVNPVTNELDTNSTKKFNLKMELSKTTPCLLECQKRYSNLDDKHKECIYTCNNEKIIDNSFFSNIAMYVYMTDKKKSPDCVIKLIYILIWFALYIQTILLLFSIFCEDLGLFKKYYFHIVDTALNSPPILGVMGTIYSFAIYTTKLDSTSDLIAGFKSSFFDAAFTTIIAGFIYLINLYFKIIILRDEDDEEE